jgi:hypothetical protein
MILNYLCPPALLYVVFSLIQVIIVISDKKYEQALTQGIICIIFTCLLQICCLANLSIIAWILVFIPVMLYTYMTLIIFLIFKLNPNAVNQYLIKNS